MQTTYTVYLLDFQLCLTYRTLFEPFLQTVQHLLRLMRPREIYQVQERSGGCQFKETKKQNKASSKSLKRGHNHYQIALFGR